MRLYGLHQVYLNNMVSRYKEGLIPDFYTYFKGAWAVAVFHDRFQTFLRDLLQNVRDNPVGCSAGRLRRRCARCCRSLDLLPFRLRPPTVGRL